MDIWATWCKKYVTCYHCKKVINAGEPMVVGKIWKKHGEATKWSWYIRWHPSCWMEQAMLSLEKRPYIPPAGRKPVEMEPEVRKARISILRRRASVVQRLKIETLRPDLDIDKIIHLGGLMDKQAKEIEKLGGVPKSWI